MTVTAMCVRCQSGVNDWLSIELDHTSDGGFGVTIDAENGHSASVWLTREQVAQLVEIAGSWMLGLPIEGEKP